MPGRHQEPSARLGVLLLTLAGLALVVLVVQLIRGEDSTPTTTLATARASTTTSASTTEPSVTVTNVGTTTSIATSSTLADPLEALFLTGDGVGEIRLGSDVDLAINQLSAVLGLPDDDTNWTTTLGTCPGTESRIVRWSSLQIFLTNGETAWASVPHFFHYGQSLAAGGGEYLDLRTDKEIGIGSTIADLKAGYGEMVTVGDDPAFGPYWEVLGEEPSYLWGTASGVADDSVIDSINGGAGCGE